MANKGAKLSRKQLLKEPDQFITFTGRVIRWVRSHTRPLAYGAAAFFAAVILAAGWAALSERREEQARQQFEDLLDRYASAEAAEGAEAALQAVETDFRRALEDYGGKDAAVPARFAFADICLKGGDPEQALVHLRRSADDFADDAFYRYLVVNKTGHAHLALKDYPRAVEAFEEVASRQGFFLRDEALFLLGEIYGETGQPQKAKAAYDKILSDHADSVYGELVREKLESEKEWPTGAPVGHQGENRREHCLAAQSNSNIRAIACDSRRFFA